MDYKEMVEQIAEHTKTEFCGGVRYVTKSIPDRTGEGILDPRLFESAKEGVGSAIRKTTGGHTGRACGDASGNRSAEYGSHRRQA